MTILRQAVFLGGNSLLSNLYPILGVTIKRAKSAPAFEVRGGGQEPIHILWNIIGIVLLGLFALIVTIVVVRIIVKKIAEIKTTREKHQQHITRVK